ncbi:alpha/beta hydrolase [Kribbella sandramycini]|uniref:Alpha/beta hydrolase n=1 Tax=Kribbella sandramycini TaxID=60450 RepID=A0A7Y4P0M6_9ACTN|nr:alpha/beta hydrolase [Kribbella sandramycini]MBB6565028.1 pimeloyl-ACP methyl ester carboxylesterase [Kribbella sandramycini]NOL41300.1 alpha/beta hydrolase [Kribbella sandramycini]
MSATATVTVAGVPGVEVAYHRQGAGEPLVLLHGIGHHWQAYDPVLDELAEHHDVIALDFPGFGASPDIPDGVPDELDSLAYTVDALCKALDVDRPHVVGNSLGGLVALRLGQLELVRTVTALSPAGFWSPRENRWALGLLTNLRRVARRTPEPTVRRLSRTPAGRRVLTGTIYHRPARRAPEAVVAESRALRDAPAFDRVAAHARRGATFEGDVPAVPVTIAWGTHDRILLPVQAARAHLQLPQARSVPLLNCGHVPMNDDPPLITRTILQTTKG